MAKIAIFESVSLDGVMQAPGRPDEDFYAIWPNQTDNPYNEALVLGSGRRLFDDPGALTKLQLVDSTPTTTGVIIATYVSPVVDGAVGEPVDR